MAMACNCLWGPNDYRCCRNRSTLRIGLSDHTTPYPPMPLEWWPPVHVDPHPYQVVPNVPHYTNWWPIKEDDEPKRGDEDMRC